MVEVGLPYPDQAPAGALLCIETSPALVPDKLSWLKMVTLISKGFPALIAEVIVGVGAVISRMNCPLVSELCRPWGSRA